MSDRVLAFDVVVVGAGPAGLAATCVAAECGRRVALVDETPWLGGQIWRRELNASNSRTSARRWFSRLQRSGAVLLPRTTVIAAPAPGLLLAQTDHAFSSSSSSSSSSFCDVSRSTPHVAPGAPSVYQPSTINHQAASPFSSSSSSSRQLRWDHLILATGARELFLPFPGWTLPGVIGPGGLHNLVKNGWPIAGKRVLVAGSGPLLLAVADGLRRHKGRVVGIVEQAPRSRVLGFGLALWRHPAKLSQGLTLRLRLAGLPFHCGAWPLRAEGPDSVKEVTLTNGVEAWKVECDYLACGFGLVPNVELPLLLNCKLTAGFVQVDALQQTTIQKVYCAGEPTGIGGAGCALVEGQIAGYAASGRVVEAERLFAARASWHQFRRTLAEAFTLRSDLKSLADDDTVICRCEDVTLGQMRPFDNWREAKLQTRCGMGACQGRTCGVAAKVLLGWGMESVRPPVLPARIHSLISESVCNDSKDSHLSATAEPGPPQPLARR